MDKQLRLAYFDASDGPRIVIFGSIEADFSPLGHLFTKLAKRQLVTSSLEREPFVKPFGNVAIALHAMGPSLNNLADSRQELERLQCTDPPVFKWKLTTDGWDHRAELVDVVVKSKQACHQYLTHYPEEAATIVVSKGEYDDRVLQ